MFVRELIGCKFGGGGGGVLAVVLKFLACEG